MAITIPKNLEISGTAKYYRNIAQPTMAITVATDHTADGAHWSSAAQVAGNEEGSGKRLVALFGQAQPEVGLRSSGDGAVKASGYGGGCVGVILNLG
jgi:hypothetical protein